MFQVYFHKGNEKISIQLPKDINFQFFSKRTTAPLIIIYAYYNKPCKSIRLIQA